MKAKGMNALMGFIDERGWAGQAIWSSIFFLIAIVVLQTVIARELGKPSLLARFDRALLTLVPTFASSNKIGPKIAQTSCGNLSLPEGLAIANVQRVRLLEQPKQQQQQQQQIVFGIEGKQQMENVVWTGENVFG